MQTNEVRKKFLVFMEKRGHHILPSSSLVPQEDATTLFTGSGMQSLIEYLSGSHHPNGMLLANSQKCFRANDIDEIGDNRHTTFFEMLGNWSLGAYFKEEQIKQCFMFLTDKNEGIGLNPNRLFITVFSGDDSYGIPRDTVSAEIWQKLFTSVGVTAKIAYIGSQEEGDRRGMHDGERIFFYDSSKNWWSRAGCPDNMPQGELGGVDTEVFFDFGETRSDDTHRTKPHPNTQSGQFMEICNSVFIEYRREGDAFVALKQKNVDYGAGLERLTAATNNNPDVFSIDILKKIIDTLSSLIQQNTTAPQYAEESKAYRIIADHIRSAVCIIAEGVTPSNTGRGYVLRRLLRSAIYHLHSLCDSTTITISQLVPICIEIYKEQYPEMDTPTIVETISSEEKRFTKTLQLGKKQYQKFVSQKKLDAESAFILQSTYGFPIELTCALASSEGINISIEEYSRVMKKHQEQSRDQSGTAFKGGLAGTSGIHIRYHTATHLLHQALRQLLGKTVEQRGSNITKERMRFDFSFPRKLTDTEKKSTEDLINEKIKEDIPVTYEDMSIEQARAEGAIGIFNKSYGDTVRVYSVGAFSKEFCGGPHVQKTGEVGRFTIVSEKAISEGVRRIRAVIE